MDNQTLLLVNLQKSSITFFVNIGEQTAKNLPQPTNSFSDYLNGNYAAHLFMFPTCEAEILHTTNMKASTSEGYDNISTKLLKQTVKEVATPLAHIVNLSQSQGIFPNDMKLAKIDPTVEPLSNDHPHQRPSLLYDHISCDVVGAAQRI